MQKLNYHHLFSSLYSTALSHKSTITIKHYGPVPTKCHPKTLSLTRARCVFPCSYCEAPAGEFVNPSHFNLLGHKHGRKHKGGLLNRTTSSSSSSSDSDREHGGALHTTGTHGHHHHNPLDTTTGTGVAHHNPLDTTTGTGVGQLHHNPLDATTGSGVSHHPTPLNTTTGTHRSSFDGSNPVTPRKRQGLLGKILNH